MSRVYEYWCDNIRRRWSPSPCPQCLGHAQEQRTEDGKRFYWWTAECDLICWRCHEELDARQAHDALFAADDD